MCMVFCLLLERIAGGRGSSTDGFVFCFHRKTKLKRPGGSEKVGLEVLTECVVMTDCLHSG